METCFLTVHKTINPLNLESEYKIRYPKNYYIDRIVVEMNCYRPKSKTFGVFGMLKKLCFCIRLPLGGSDLCCTQQLPAQGNTIPELQSRCNSPASFAIWNSHEGFLAYFSAPLTSLENSGKEKALSPSKWHRILPW